MSTRQTRGAAIKASFPDKENLPHLSSPPSTPQPLKATAKSTTKKTATKASSDTLTPPDSMAKPKKNGGRKVKNEAAETPNNITKKRKIALEPDLELQQDDEIEYEDLPHNMGRVKKAKLMPVEAAQAVSGESLAEKLVAGKPSSSSKRITRATRSSRVDSGGSSRVKSEGASSASHEELPSFTSKAPPSVTRASKKSSVKSEGPPRKKRATKKKQVTDGEKLESNGDTKAASPLDDEGLKGDDDTNAAFSDDNDELVSSYEDTRIASPKKKATNRKAPTASKTSPKKKAIKGKAASASKTSQKKTPAKTNSTSPKKEKATKKETYGLTEGVSPYPDYTRPTPEECYTVAETLRKAHPDCHLRPKTIPEPSQIVAGCGEVPSILDAMIRTLLSAATLGSNSSSSYKAMVARYGIRESGVGKGSVDYNKVRLASQADLYDTLHAGGLADNKSGQIKKILDMVYADNQARREANLAAKGTDNNAAAAKGALTDEQRNAEIALADDEILSLDHLYYLPTYEAIFKFLKYPGIGVKTAACVSLFCMQRDCFAVDTHVFRLCKWLGWVPDQGPDGKDRPKGVKKVDRDTMFSHLEVRIPDELKYDLHQLFIAHGKKCGRCQANRDKKSKEWKKGCPIDKLVKRTGKNANEKGVDSDDEDGESEGEGGNSAGGEDVEMEE